MENPFISVIIPVYNIKEYLERCVQSVCAQTYGNLEILLIDDGSTDGTGQLCDELAHRDERIRVFHKENGGSSSARNLGIAQAKGDYLGFVDSDDYISENMYELLWQGMQACGAEIAQVGRDETDAKGNMRPDICKPPAHMEFVPAEDFFRELLLHRGDCSFCTKLVSRKLFAKLRFPEGELNEDFKLLILMLQETKGVVSLPQQAYHVFYRIGSNTRKEDKNEFSRVYGDCVANADLAAEIAAAWAEKPGNEKGNSQDLEKLAMRFGLFQRLEYLLHIPILQMTRENGQYRDICKYVRKHWKDAVSSPYLTGKNKVYLVLFAIAPKTIRKVHRRLKCR